MTVIPSFFTRFFNVPITSEPVALSNAPVGSSARTTLGSTTKDLAIDTLCC